MSDDLKLATQDGVYAALEDMDGLDIDGEPARVLQHVPQDTQPPLVVIGDIAADEIGAKDGSLERHIVEIVTEYRGPARKWLYLMMGEVKTRLVDAALAASAGVVLSSPTFEGSEDGMLEDGQTYQGRQRFALFAQRDD